MKKLPQHLENNLIHYLDSSLPETERLNVELQLQQDAALRERLSELQAADAVLRQIAPEQPSRNFTTRVMSRLSEYPVRKSLSIRNGIFLLAGLIAVAVLTAMLVSSGAFDQTATYNLNDIDLMSRYLKQNAPQVPIDGKWIVNIIILLNLALAFVVLDRTILKPLFQKRMQAGH